MTAPAVALPASQTESVAASRGRRWRSPRSRSLVMLVCGVTASLVALSRGQAGEEDDDDEKPAAVAGGRQFNITEQSFDQLVFGVSGGTQIVVEGGVRRTVLGPGSAATAVRKRMETAIDSEIQFIESRCRLTNAQAKKLRLAGRGDVESFLGRAEDLRKKVVGRTLDQQQYSQLSMEMSLLRMSSQNNLLGEASLFRKTLRGTLSDEQRAEYQAIIHQRQVDAAVAGLAAWDRVNNNANISSLKLTPETRRKLCERVAEQGRLPESNTTYMNYIVLLEAGRIEDQVRPLLDDEQWQAFQKLIAQAKRVESSIRRYAQWPATPPVDDEDDSTAASTK